MSRPIIGLCSLPLLALLLASGCAGLRCSDPRLIVHEAVMKGVNALDSDPKERFAVTQLEAMLGKPEHIMSQREFYSLVGQIDPLLVHLFRLSTESALPRPEVSDKCLIWIYAWTHPMEWHAEVIGFLVRRHIAERWSFAYVTYDSEVLFAGHIER